jgi:ATP-dependent Clp protease adaptor protein ClpS
MAESDQVAVATPPAKPAEKAAKPIPRRQPPYHVVLLDDDDHTYEYVVEMLGKLFGHNVEKAFMMAREVDTTGRVIVDTTTKERAELKRDQIHAYGADWRLKRCKGSMRATIEPAPDAG